MVQVGGRDIKRMRKAGVKPELFRTKLLNMTFYHLAVNTAPAKCQFLIDNKCSIYDHRPDACKSFTCKLYGKLESELADIVGSGDVKRYVDSKVEPVEPPPTILSVKDKYLKGLKIRDVDNIPGIINHTYNKLLEAVNVSEDR
jgi:Fe-S-cluster containining protein